MIDAQVDRLYKLLLKGMSDMEHRLIREFDSRMSLRFDDVNIQLDHIRGLLDTDELERGAMNAQLNRHETRITRLEQTSST